MGLQGLNLRQLQTELKNFLNLDAWFVRIPIITEELGDVVTIADAAVARLNTCVVIETATFDDTEGNVRGVRGFVTITLSVWENVSINRNPEAPQIHASDTAQVLLSMVKNFQGTTELNCGPFHDGSMHLLDDLKRQIAVTAYVVKFKALSGFSYETVAAAGGILGEGESVLQQILGEGGQPLTQG